MQGIYFLQEDTFHDHNHYLDNPFIFILLLLMLSCFVMKDTFSFTIPSTDNPLRVSCSFTKHYSHFLLHIPSLIFATSFSSLPPFLFSFIAACDTHVMLFVMSHQTCVSQMKCLFYYKT